MPSLGLGTNIYSFPLSYLVCDLSHRYAAFDFPLPVRKQLASFGRRILPRQVCKLSVIILIVEIDRRISDELTPDAQHRSCVTRKGRVPNKGQSRQRYVTRSEEHTSELQSLMRISYAVFCLKKKTNKQEITQTTLSYKP